MNRNMWLVLRFALLSCLASVSATASNCPAGGTTVFFGNGVLTTLFHAEITTLSLEVAVEQELNRLAPNRDISCVQYKTAHDTLFFNGDGTIASVGNFLLQLFVAAVQSGIDQTLAWGKLHEFRTSDPSLDDALNNLPIATTSRSLVNSAVSLVQPNVQAHKALYESEFQAGNNVIVVAHSQGNFYVNQVFGLLRVPSNREFGTVALASPAGAVLGNVSPNTCFAYRGLPCYLTLRNDIITLVPGSLPANIENINTPDRCAAFPRLWSMYKCHTIDYSYFLGNFTRRDMLDSIVRHILNQVSLSSVGTGVGTVRSVPDGINCSNCSTYFYRGTKLSLTADPAPGSVFSGWGGSCTPPDPADKNSIMNVTLAGDIACTAKFDLDQATCPPLSVCGRVTYAESGNPISGRAIEVRSASGALVGAPRTDTAGRYLLGSLSPTTTYRTSVVSRSGESVVPLQNATAALPGGQPLNYQIFGVAATVNVTGPNGSWTILTTEAVTSPPCLGGVGCTGIASAFISSGVATLRTSARSPWLTCYISPGSQKTSSQQLTLQPDQTITLSCPPF